MNVRKANMLKSLLFNLSFREKAGEEDLLPLLPSEANSSLDHVNSWLPGFSPTHINKTNEK